MEKLGNKFKSEIEKMEHYKPSLKTKERILVDVERLLGRAIKEGSSGEIAIAFSGGIDSALLALIAEKIGVKFKLFCVGLEDSPDVLEAEKLAYEKKWNIVIYKIKEKDVENAVKKVVKIIPKIDFTNVNIASVEFLLYGLIKKAGYKAVITGLGAEEVFGGYKRHRDAENVQKECWNGLKNVYEQDLLREYALSEHFGLEIRAPFLDRTLLEYGMQINPLLKVNSKGDKFILRELGLRLGLSKEIAFRAKKAMQYGSGFDKVIGKLAKKSKGEYVNSFLNLGVLYSSGKDSNLALLKMHEQGFSIKCLITMESLNSDSYMFHTPAIEMTRLQAKALDLPLVLGVTKGEKEKELKDLRALLVKAKEKYKLDGVVTGSLFSNYQKERIEKVCSELGLRCFSPLWHMDQEKELREVVEKFEVILTGVAASGLDKSWLGRVLTDKDVDELVKLKINVAFEGGEAESLVLNGPLFSKRIVIKDSEIVEEGKCVARLNVKKAVLE